MVLKKVIAPSSSWVSTLKQINKIIGSSPFDIFPSNIELGHVRKLHIQKKTCGGGELRMTFHFQTVFFL